VAPNRIIVRAHTPITVLEDAEALLVCEGAADIVPDVVDGPVRDAVRFATPQSRLTHFSVIVAAHPLWVMATYQLPCVELPQEDTAAYRTEVTRQMWRIATNYRDAGIVNRAEMPVSAVTIHDFPDECPTWLSREHVQLEGASLDRILDAVLAEAAG
jgi:hypothetical protein